MSTVKKFLTRSELLESLHGPFFPSDVRAGEPISASVYFDEKQDRAISMRVWKISPLGIELILGENSENIPKGSKISIEINVGAQISKFDGLVVDFIESEGGNKILGVRLVTGGAPRSVHADKRKLKRWICSEQFLPTGVCHNPAKYNDFIYFRVKDLSASGMQIVTSLRNKFLLEGMRLDLSVSFPMISQLSAKVKVENVRLTKEGNSEYLALGVTFEEKTTELLEVIGQYLTQFGIVSSLNDLYEQGLSPISIGDSISFSYVKSTDDYKEVLQLRWLAYKDEGKLEEGLEPEDLADIYDTRSRIVIGRYQGKPICTGRMTFNEYDQKLEQEEYIKWSDKLPRREQSVEIMRVCTHPDFRGSDLLLAMFRFMAAAVVQSKREWIILSTTEKFVPLYLKMGGRETGESFPHPTLNNSEHKVILGEVKNCLNGRHVSGLYWNIIYGNLISYLINYDVLSLSPVDRIRIRIYQMVGPITKFYEKYILAPKREERARLRVMEKKVKVDYAA